MSAGSSPAETQARTERNQASSAPALTGRRRRGHAEVQGRSECRRWRRSVGVGDGSSTAVPPAQREGHGVAQAVAKRQARPDDVVFCIKRCARHKLFGHHHVAGVQARGAGRPGSRARSVVGRLGEVRREGGPAVGADSTPVTFNAGGASSAELRQGRRPRRRTPAVGLRQRSHQSWA